MLSTLRAFFNVLIQSAAAITGFFADLSTSFAFFLIGAEMSSCRHASQLMSIICLPIHGLAAFKSA